MDEGRSIDESRRTLLKGTAAAGVGAVTYSSSAAAQSDQWEVTGPDGLLTATVTRNGEGALSISVARDGRTVLEPSPLGITTETTAFETGLSFVERSDESVEETYETETGKRLEHHHRAEQASLTFEKGGSRMNLDVRVAQQGMSYRYRLPGEGDVAVTGERTAFELPDEAEAWLMPQEAKYEAEWRQQSASIALGDFNFPTLFEVGEDWVLLSEADMSGRYCGSYLRTRSASNTYDLLFAKDQSGPVTSERPLRTPWRAMVVGDLGDVVESDLMQSLSPPSRIDDTSWIEPGRVAWSWWSRDALQSREVQENFIDYAAEQGWEYYLIDAGWQESWFPDLIDYANEQGVEIILWNRWNGGHGGIEDTGPAGPNEDEARERLFSQWAEWGAAGMKLDFMDSDSQERMQFLDDVLESAAEHELMVNFHGSTLPRGTRRTWPNEVTRESVKGGEYYKWDENPIDHNVVLPFTRNVVGAMDYTPAIFSASEPEPAVTAGFWLATAVVYESGHQHLADDYEVYQQYPRAERLFRNVGAAWEETVFLGGRPGEEATLARKHGAEWFVGSIVEGAARDVEVSLEFLDADRQYVAEITRDADGADDLTIDHQRVTGSDSLTVPVAEHGGFTVRLVPASLIEPVVEVTNGPLSIESDTPVTVEAEVTNPARHVATHLDLSLDLPDRWTVTDESGTTLSQLDPEESESVSWTVDPGQVSPGTYSGDVSLTFRHRRYCCTETVDWRVQFTAEAAALPERWSTVDTAPGSEAEFGYNEQNDSLTINAGGADVWWELDEYGAIYDESLSLSDGETATVEIVEDDNTDQYAKAGIMVANDITAPGESAPDLIVFASPSTGFKVEWDDDSNGYVGASQADGTTQFPCHVRVSRDGDTFTGEYSTDGGDTWSEIHSIDLSGMDGEPDVGMFKTSHEPGTKRLTEFADFTVE